MTQEELELLYQLLEKAGKVFPNADYFNVDLWPNKYELNGLELNQSIKCRGWTLDKDNNPKDYPVHIVRPNPLSLI